MTTMSHKAATKTLKVTTKRHKMTMSHKAATKRHKMN